jgi:branched-chain amino acid transport system substrate-binding protein
MLSKQKILTTMLVMFTLALLAAQCGGTQVVEQAVTVEVEKVVTVEVEQEIEEIVTVEVTKAAEAAVASEGEPITIGAVFNATGWMAAYDQPPREGALLAVKAINEAGGVLGRPLALIELDGSTDPATVGNAALQLIEQGADVLLAPCDFDIGGPASQAAQAAGLVGLSTCASSPLFGSAALGDKQFTLSMWNNIMSAGAAEYAYNELGWRNAYVVTDTSIDYSLSLGDYFTEHFKSLGGEIVAEDTYLQGDADFSAQIQRIQGLAEPPDGLFISSYSPDLGTIIRQTRAAGIETPIMGGDAYDDTEFFAVLGPEAGNEVYFATHGWLGPESGEDMPRFIELYEAEYGQAPGTAFILTGWDAVNVLAQAIEAAGTTDGAAVAKAMEEMQFDLLSGSLNWAPAADGHQPQKEVAIVQLQGGEASFLQWVFPESFPEP